MNLNNLYAPQREEYHTTKRPDKCVFCSAWEQDAKLDDETQLIWKDKECFVIMNKYPYNPGHFMIIPAKHECNLEDLDTTVWLRMNELAQIGVTVLKQEVCAAGVNIGLNLGEAAGAGIAEHLHLHLVPRYHRDTNFITTIANNRVYSANFDKIFTNIKNAFVSKMK